MNTQWDKQIARKTRNVLNEGQQNKSKFMKCRLNSGQRVYSSQYLCLKRTKISSQYLAFHLKKTRKRRINLIQTKEKEGDSKL